MKIWNFGIVGAGLIADFHARAIRDLPNAALAGIYNVRYEKARVLADKHGTKAFESLDCLFEQSDVVTIATPSGAHMEPAMAAANAGRHVICEKPMEITTERIDAMANAHRQAGTQLGGIFQNRFNPAMYPLRKAINDGRFGTVTCIGVYVPWWRGDEYYKDSWHGTLELDGGGAMMNQSIHMIDMLCDLVGLPRQVTAYISRAGHPQIEAEDSAVALLKYDNGTLGLIYGTTSSWPGRFKQFEITGTKGTAVYLEDGFTVWKFAEETDDDETIRTQFAHDPAGGGGVADPAAITCQNHTKNFQAFLNALENGNEFEINAAEARKSVRLIQAIYHSAKTGNPVNLENE